MLETLSERVVRLDHVSEFLGCLSFNVRVTYRISNRSAGGSLMKHILGAPLNQGLSIIGIEAIDAEVNGSVVCSERFLEILKSSDGPIRPLNSWSEEEIIGQVVRRNFYVAIEMLCSLCTHDVPF